MWAVVIVSVCCRHNGDNHRSSRLRCRCTANDCLPYCFRRLQVLQDSKTYSAVKLVFKHLIGFNIRSMKVSRC